MLHARREPLVERLPEDSGLSGQVYRQPPGATPAPPGRHGVGTSNLSVDQGDSRFGSVIVMLRSGVGEDGRMHGTIYRCPMTDAPWAEQAADADVRGSFDFMQREARRLVAEGFGSVTVVYPVRNFGNSRTVADVSW